MRGYNRTSNTDVNPPPSSYGRGIKSKLSNMMNLNNNASSQQQQQQQRQQQRSRSTSRGRRMSIPTNTRRDGIRSTSADNNNKEYERRDSISTDGTDIVPPDSGANGGGNKRFSRPNINLSMPRVRRSNNNANTTNNGENQQQGEEEFQNTRLQYFNERSSSNTNANNGGGNYKNYYNNNKHSNWILPTNYKLSSRIDIWFLLVISSCCAVASIGSIHSSAGKSSGSGSGMGSTSGGFTSNEKFALSTSATSFILSFVMAIGLRYAPLRSSLTTNIYPPERSYDNNNDGRGSNRRRKKRCLSIQGQIILSSFNITYELLVLSLLSIFWMASMGIICNDTSYYNGGNGMDAPSVPLAMAGSTIWNENIFYSTWISALLCGYLWVEVYTLIDRRGVIKLYNISPSNSSQEEGGASCADSQGQVGLPQGQGTTQGGSSSSINKTPNNVFTKRWTLLSFTSLIIMSSSIVTYNSPSCSGDLLRSTSYCSRALVGILIGGFLQLLVCASVAILYRLSYMSRVGTGLRPHSSRGRRSSILSLQKRNLGTGICTLVSLIVQAVNTGLLTSPTGGGPGNTSGTLYFACWIGFIISFELCLRLMEFYGSANSSSGGSNGGNSNNGGRLLIEDVTIYEDEDEQDVESYLMLRNGSDTNSHNNRGANSSGNIHNKTTTRNGRNLVVVEDVYSDDDEESFVFAAGGGANKNTKPPDIAANKHYGGGQDPEEATSAAAYIAQQQQEQQRLRNSPQSYSGSDRVGSIDARSEPSSSKSSRIPEPDGEYVELRKSSRYSSYNDEDLNNSAFFDDQFDKHVPHGGGNHSGSHGRSRTPRSYSNEPDAMKMNSKSIILTSFHNDQLEELEEDFVKTSSNSNDSQLKKHSTQGSGKLSPLEEGSQEISPNTGSGSQQQRSGAANNNNSGGHKSSSNQVGDNLKTMQAMRGVIQEVRSKASTRSGSRSRSRERKQQQQQQQKNYRQYPEDDYNHDPYHHNQNNHNQGLSALPTAAGMGGMEGVHLTTSQSKQSAVSRMTMPSMSTPSRSHYTDKSGSHVSGTQGSRSRMSSTRSASTMSSRGPSTAVSGGGSVLTDDESGSNPPPTVSDGTKDDESGFSLPSTKSKSLSSGNRNNNKKSSNNNPPPPPFRRSNKPQPEYDAASQYTESAPVRAVHTNKGGSYGDADSIVSDPTLDPGLANPPPPLQQAPMRTTGTSPTNSYDKKYSDSTDMHSSPKSEENPASQDGEGSKQVVDNIVAAALAYAEKTHGESDNHGIMRMSGTTTASSAVRNKPPLSTGQRMKPPPPPKVNDPLRASTRTEESGLNSGSIHSFFTETSGKDKSESTGNPMYAQSAPVDDLVAKALSHAQGQLENGKKKQEKEQQQNQEKHPSQHWSSGKSMYSEDETEASNPEGQFDC